MQIERDTDDVVEFESVGVRGDVAAVSVDRHLLALQPRQTEQVLQQPDHPQLTAHLIGTADLIYHILHFTF